MPRAILSIDYREYIFPSHTDAARVLDLFTKAEIVNNIARDFNGEPEGGGRPRLEVKILPDKPAAKKRAPRA